MPAEALIDGEPWICLDACAGRGPAPTASPKHRVSWTRRTVMRPARRAAKPVRTSAPSPAVGARRVMSDHRRGAVGEAMAVQRQTAASVSADECAPAAISTKVGGRRLNRTVAHHREQPVGGLHGGASGKAHDRGGADELDAVVVAGQGELAFKLTAYLKVALVALASPNSPTASAAHHNDQSWISATTGTPNMPAGMTRRT